MKYSIVCYCPQNMPEKIANNMVPNGAKNQFVLFDGNAKLEDAKLLYNIAKKYCKASF